MQEKRLLTIVRLTDGDTIPFGAVLDSTFNVLSRTAPYLIYPFCLHRTV